MTIEIKTRKRSVKPFRVYFTEMLTADAARGTYSFIVEVPSKSEVVIAAHAMKKNPADRLFRIEELRS